jgi:hypothetical protein
MGGFGKDLGIFANVQKKTGKTIIPPLFFSL